MSKYTEAISSIYFTMHNRVKPKTLGHCEDENPEEKLIDVYCGEIPSEKELHYYCQNCNEWVGDEWFKYNFCPCCGQALDWGEKNDEIK